MAESKVPLNRNWIHDLGDIYNEQIFKNTNPVVMSWPLVANDWLIMGILAFYLSFINVLGPSFMRNRKPFDLRWIMVPYNIALVLVNFFIFFEYSRIWLSGGGDFYCPSVNFNLNPVDNPKKYRLMEITWYYYITKYVELFDTVFFVLRKKERQLSLLHKLHHFSIPGLASLLVRSFSGNYTFFPLANSFVHVLMYTYYGLSAMGDDVTIHLKYKKYMTMTQMIQFVLVITHILTLPFFGCTWNPYIGYIYLLIAGGFFLLFCNFYWNEYHSKDIGVKQNGHVKQKSM